MSITPEIAEAVDYLRTWARMVHADRTALEADIKAAKAVDVLDNAELLPSLDEVANELETAAQFAAVDPEEWGDTTRADMARHQEG